MIIQMWKEKVESLAQKWDSPSRFFRYGLYSFCCLMLSFLVICPCLSYAQEDNFIGGPCSYLVTNGIGTIQSITEDTSGANLPYTAQKVLFTFATHANIPTLAGNIQNEKHLFTLTNGMLPGPQFLTRYNIQPGATFPVQLKTITHGTCTPVILEFSTINQSDYFEFSSQQIR